MSLFSTTMGNNDWCERTQSYTNHELNICLSYLLFVHVAQYNFCKLLYSRFLYIAF